MGNASRSHVWPRGNPHPGPVAELRLRWSCISIALRDHQTAGAAESVSRLHRGSHASGRKPPRKPRLLGGKYGLPLGDEPPGTTKKPGSAVADPDRSAVSDPERSALSDPASAVS